MRKLKSLLKKPWAAYTFAACCAVLLYVVLSHWTAVWSGVKSFLSAASPIIIGLVIAYLLSPIARFFKTKLFRKIKKDSARHTAGVIMTLICFVLLLALLLLALIPSLVQSIGKLVDNWPDYIEKIDDLLVKVSALLQGWGIAFNVSSLSGLVDQYMDNVMELIKNNSDAILNALGNIGTGIANFAVGVVFGFCFLETEKLIISVTRRLRLLVETKERFESHNTLLNRCNNIFLRYVGCTLLDALIIGVVTLVFNLIAKVPYAPLIAVVVGITNIVPTFGPIVGGAIGCFFIVLESPIKALLFLVFICVIQAVDGTIIKPRLFSGSLGISGVWTLVLIIIGGKIAGVLGIVLAIPLAAMFVIVYQETIVPRMDKRYHSLNTKKEE